VFNIAWFTTGLFGNFIAYASAWSNFQYLCKTTLFMTLRFSGEVITVVFAIIGAVITYQIMKMPRTTKYEKSLLSKQIVAVKRLWVVIGTFIVVSVALCIYDFISFKSNNCRVVIPDSQVLNDIVWYVMRALGYQMWAIPLLIVFWPINSLKILRD
jgi:ABC-type transport system involved in multi-copper enzyme maturation permease subunit